MQAADSIPRISAGLTVLLIALLFISPLPALADESLDELLAKIKSGGTEKKIVFITKLHQGWKKAEADLLLLSYEPVDTRKVHKWAAMLEENMILLRTAHIEPKTEKGRLVEAARRDFYKASKYYKASLDLLYKTYKEVCSDIDERNCVLFANPAKLQIVDRNYHEGKNWMSIAGYKLAEAESIP